MLLIVHQKHAACLRLDDRGATSVIFAVCAAMLFAALGAMFDGIRWTSARARHAAIVDASLLAAARALQIDANDTSGATSLANKLYTTSLANLGETLRSNTVAFVVDDAARRVSLTGDAFIPTTVLQVVGIAQLSIVQPASAQLSQGLNAGSNIEIAMMLDVTGSMCDDGVGPCASGTKINGLKTAATDLANIVLGKQGTNYTSRIALVPYSSDVRIDANGSSNPLMQTLTGLPQTWSGWVNGWSCTSGSQDGEYWTGGGCTQIPPYYVANQKLSPCVTERAFGSNFDASDSAPQAGNWIGAGDGTRRQASWDSTDTPLTSGLGALASDPSDQWSYAPDGDWCESQQGNEILPLSSDLTTIKSRISGLTAYGSTAGALGVAWTQYLLSPNWGSIWTGNQRPGSYSDTRARQSNGAPNLRKVAVLLTDGAFNTYRRSASPVSIKDVSSKALSVCANMKENGIEIYAVGFNLDALPANEREIATQTLKGCGSDINHFYNSLDTTQLTMAFRDIALRMVKVHLVQ